jgi:hypothetical protein
MGPIGSRFKCLVDAVDYRYIRRMHVLLLAVNLSKLYLFDMFTSPDVRSHANASAKLGCAHIPIRSSKVFIEHMQGPHTAASIHVMGEKGVYLSWFA